MFASTDSFAQLKVDRNNGLAIAGLSIGLGLIALFGGGSLARLVYGERNNDAT
jgi:hypothetical protein